MNFLVQFMDMGSFLRYIVGTILNYKRGPYVPISSLNGPLVTLILTVAHKNLTLNPQLFFCQTLFTPRPTAIITHLKLEVLYGPT